MVGRDSVEPWFFSDAARVTALLQAVGECRDTPFAEDGHAPGAGGGLDCVGFIEYVLGKAGVGQGLGGEPGADFHFPRAENDFSRHVHNNKILDYLDGKFPLDPQSSALAQIFVRLPLPERKKKTAFIHYFDPPFMSGDLLVMRTGLGQWHLPVMVDDRSFYHCAFPDGVTEGDIMAPNYFGDETQPSSKRTGLVRLYRARLLQ